LNVVVLFRKQFVVVISKLSMADAPGGSSTSLLLVWQ
jgi:hypothetical protein